MTMALTFPRNAFLYSFHSVSDSAVIVERWLPAAPGLMHALNSPIFFPIVPMNVPQNESYLPQSFMPLSMTITVQKRTECSDWPELHAHPRIWGKDQSQVNHKN